MTTPTTFATIPAPVLLALGKYFSSAEGKKALDAARAATPSGAFAMSATVAVSATVKVDPDEVYDATTSISRVMVAMAFESAVSAAFSAMTARLDDCKNKIRAAGMVEAAEAVATALGTGDPAELTAGVVADAVSRWNASDPEADEAKARWEATFKGKVTGKKPRAGKVHVRPNGTNPVLRVIE